MNKLLQLSIVLAIIAIGCYATPDWWPLKLTPEQSIRNWLAKGNMWEDHEKAFTSFDRYVEQSHMWSGVAAGMANITGIKCAYDEQTKCTNDCLYTLQSIHFVNQKKTYSHVFPFNSSPLMHLVELAAKHQGRVCQDELIARGKKLLEETSESEPVQEAFKTMREVELVRKSMKDKSKNWNTFAELSRNVNYEFADIRNNALLHTLYDFVKLKMGAGFSLSKMDDGQTAYMRPACREIWKVFHKPMGKLTQSYRLLDKKERHLDDDYADKLGMFLFCERTDGRDNQKEIEQLIEKRKLPKTAFD